MKRITDKMRMDYLEACDIATEFHEEWDCCYCVSRLDGLWEKAKTLREDVDAAIRWDEVNDN